MSEHTNHGVRAMVWNKIFEHYRDLKEQQLKKHITGINLLADAYMVSIGNYVCIAADMKFVTHDVFNIMFNNSFNIKNL